MRRRRCSGSPLVWTAAAVTLGLYARWARDRAASRLAPLRRRDRHLRLSADRRLRRRRAADLRALAFDVASRLSADVSARGDRRARRRRACRRPSALERAPVVVGRARRRRRAPQSAACGASRREHGTRPRLHARRRRAVRPCPRRRRLRRAARRRAWSRAAAPSSLAGGSRSRCALGHAACPARHQRRNARVGGDPHAAARPSPRLRPARRRGDQAQRAPAPRVSR